MKKTLRCLLPAGLALVALIAVVVILAAAVSGPGSDEALAEGVQQSRYSTPVSLIDAAQTLSTTWVDLGSEVDTERYDHIGLWLSITISDSTDVRVRALAKHTAGGTDEYYLPINTVGSSDVKIEDEYLEFNEDADQEMVLAWGLDNIVPMVQFQVQVSAVGTTAGQIESAYVTRGY